MKMLVSAAAVVLAVVSLAPQARAAASDPSGDLPHIRPIMDQTLETEKSGIEVRWSNPTTGNRGMIRVERTFYRDDRPCREYLRTVERPEGTGWVIRGTACRVERGRWEVRNEIPTETGAKEGPRTPSRPTTTTGSESPETRAEPAAASPEPEEPAAAATPPAGPRAETGAGSTEGRASADEAEAAPADEPFVAFTRPARTGI